MPCPIIAHVPGDCLHAVRPYPMNSKATERGRDDIVYNERNWRQPNVNNGRGSLTHSQIDSHPQYNTICIPQRCLKNILLDAPFKAFSSGWMSL